MSQGSFSRSTSDATTSYTLLIPGGNELPSTVLKRIDEKLKDAKQILETASEVEAKGEHVLGNLTGVTEKLDVADLVEMDRALQALLWIETIKSVGKELDDIWSTSTSVNPTKKKSKEDDAQVILLHRTLVALVSALVNSTCSNLRLYAVKMLECHRERWIERLEKQVEEDLEAIHFPQCLLDLDLEQSTAANDELATKSESKEFLSGKSTAEDMLRVNQLQKRYRMLCDLKLPEDVASTLTALKVSDPLSILLCPLKKRFKFHFSGTKKTNNPEKPEWYLQQVGAWMRNSQKFFDVCIHPIRKSDEMKEFPGHAQFCCGLLSLVIAKLRRDIAEIMYDDVTLSHLIDETILFSRDVLSRDFSLFIPLESLPLVVLCDPTVFSRWISLERKFAFEKVDDLLLEDGSWSQSVSRPDVSKCTLTFEALLQSITNRYKALSSVQLQLNFVDLQIELLEDLRLRLAQILRQEQAFPMSHKFCLILSSSQYLIDMLGKWAEIPLFLQLQLERSKATQDPDNKRGLFRDSADGFDFLVSDLIKTLSENVFYEVKSRSRPYRCDVKWFSYCVHADTTWDTTPESFPMFQLLAAHLTHLSNWLSGSALLARVVSQICEHLCTFYITDFILENSFSRDGSKQVTIDVERGLGALFEPFLMEVKRPGSYEQLREVCHLLNLAQANAILMLDALGEKADAKPILEEFNIHFLTSEQSVKILKRRIDLQ